MVGPTAAAFRGVLGDAAPMPDRPLVLSPMAAHLDQLVPIPGGTFRMGSSEGMLNEAPVHEVSVSAFGLAAFPTSNGQFREYLQATGAEPPPFLDTPGYGGDRQPVTGVSWFQAIDYIEWLESLVRGRLPAGRTLRLPTEAEREWAARGGHAHASLYPWGDGPPAWAGDYPNPALAENLRPPELGFGQANDYGLHHMAEVVHEWCCDWYGRQYYRSSPSRDPAGPDNGTRRSARGGSWRHAVPWTRITARSSIPPDRQFADFGFRVAMGARPTEP